jgi:signal peptidase II
VSDRATGWRRAAMTVAIVLAADQLTKALVRRGIDGGEHDSVFPGVDLVHVRNNGVAFGLLGGGGVALTVLTGVALTVLLAYFALNSHRAWVWLPTGLLIGGAVGNLIDRLAYGSVTDFIDLPFWPAFNVADVAITAGVAALLLVLESQSRSGHDAEARSDGEAAPAP